MEVRLKDIRAFNAVDVTNADPNEVYRIASGRQTVAYSCGTYGVNGIVVEKDGAFYKVIGRATNLFILL